MNPTDEHRKLAEDIDDFDRRETTGDYEIYIKGVTEIIAQFAADLTERVRAETLAEAAAIPHAWAVSTSCQGHDDNPCCHVRLGAEIERRILALKK